MISTLSQMYLQPLEGTPLAWLRPFTGVGFLLGAWAVLFKTLYIATAANSRLTTDFLSHLGVWHPADAHARQRMTNRFCVIYPLLALALYYISREPQGLIKAGGIAQALLLPFIAGVTFYLRRSDPDHRAGPSRLTVFLNAIALVSVTAVAAYSLWAASAGLPDQIRRLLHSLSLSKE